MWTIEFLFRLFGLRLVENIHNMPVVFELVEDELDKNVVFHNSVNE